jgi:3-phenylpropionate/trans-cinnamate dioxygenase ferredoxin reductase subunit
MSNQDYKYIIVGGGLSGASAVDGIRELDKNGSISLVSAEKHLPYDRPPLSKKLWFGKKKVEEIFVHDQQYYDQKGVQLALGRRITEIDVSKKTLTDEQGTQYRYQKLLLSTGGTPRKLTIPGGDMKEIIYYRSLDDYQLLRSEATRGKTALVVGGGFIGSEIAAALKINGMDVTMIFPESYLVSRVFPESLGQAIQKDYVTRGIKIINGDVPASFSRNGSRFLTRTKKGNYIDSDVIVIGVGIVPEISLAEKAGLQTGNGIEVNEYLQTSAPDIYAAGDNAHFHYQVLGRKMRIEHWDNAINQGKWAGRNMAGAHEPYSYMPYFFSDLFDFGYEAVGDVNSQLETLADWQKENNTGVIYYLEDGTVRGAMMCNVWDKVEAARELIRKGKRMTAKDLRGAIK